MMDTKNILLYERYDGVRFVLEKSLNKYKEEIDIHATHLKHDVKKLINKVDVDLLITELSILNPDGLEVSLFARKVDPEINIIWITVLGCNVFAEKRKQLGNILCIEKPIIINDFRKDVLEALSNVS